MQSILQTFPGFFTGHSGMAYCSPVFQYIEIGNIKNRNGHDCQVCRHLDFLKRLAKHWLFTACVARFEPIPRLARSRYLPLAAVHKAAKDAA
jgi:ribosomal protein L37AE/L43A